MRLRPIIMTRSPSFFGCVPLAIAMGAAPRPPLARHRIIGGMIGASTLALL